MAEGEFHERIAATAEQLLAEYRRATDDSEGVTHDQVRIRAREAASVITLGTLLGLGSRLGLGLRLALGLGLRLQLRLV